MSVRPILLKDIRRTAISNHQQATGSGNYNRFGPLVRDRLPSTGKRPLNADDAAPDPKAPRLDANLVFAQLKDQDTALQEAKAILKKAVETGEECCSAKDGAIGSIIHSLLHVMSIMLTSHENLTSALVDSVKVYQSEPYQIPHKGPPQKNPGNPGHARASVSQPPAPPPSDEDNAKKKLKHSIREAEKKTLIFNLDLGQVPTINKDTLSRKVTMALSDKAKAGDHNYNVTDAEETIDDVLSCAKLEFLGAGSKKYFNSCNPADKRNNKFCTMPVRMDFKDKETRIQAEISMRKLCKVSCSTPYPKRLRTILAELVKEGKKAAPDCFICTRVNVDKLTIDVHAKNGKEWVDLNLSREIPTQILDPFSDALDTMDESEAAPLS